MCDPVLIAAILEELGYLNEKKQKDKKAEVHNKENAKEDLKNSEREEEK
jgi:hypothetical protein